MGQRLCPASWARHRPLVVIKKSMRIAQLLILAIIIFHSCKNSEERKTGDKTPLDKLAKIDSICQAFIDKGNTIGMSIGLSHNGNIIFSKGYGLANIESGIAATDSTIYPIASISKFITAITALKIVDEGKLSLSDKISDHIEEFPSQEYMDEITIEHLLRHQSGLVDHEDWFDSIYINERRIFTNEELYEFLDQPLFFQPGSQYSYSNSGYSILSTILENIEQKPFHQLVTEKISKPFQLQSLGMWPEKWDDKNAALGYELVDDKVDTSFHMMTEGMKGDGGLSASVIDLLKLMDNLAQGTIIPESSFEYMLTPTPIGNISIDYGLGVKFGNFGNQKTFGHSGGYKGTGWAMLSHYPESGYTFAATINTNYSPEEVWTLRHLIMPIVLEIKPPILDSAKVHNIEKYVGKYSAFNRWGYGNPSVRIVSEKEGRLFWDNPDTKTPAAQLYPLSDSTFTFEPYPYDIFRFHHVNGEVVACSQYADGFFTNIRMKNDHQ